ncbi:MAG: DNA polymerase III subunit [Acidobacteria bacterium]|nr:DNA polymerase III subunit [Acidobacteriota bacterium]
MGFESFIGNSNTVELLRSMMTKQRLPHAILLSGPAGIGKYTLAQMLTKAIFCVNDQKHNAAEFCGECRNCRLIALADDRHAAVERAEEEREKLSRRPREIPLRIQHHADLCLLPPNGPLRHFQIEQARYLKEALTFLPASGRKKVFILPEVERMDEAAANALLKSLEEPPPYALLLLTTASEASLLPTIRSRCVTLWMAPVQRQHVCEFLKRSGVGADQRERELRAALSNGCPGAAQRMDLEHYLSVRESLLALLHAGASRRDFAGLFRHTQNLSREKERLENLLRVLYSLLQDILHIETKANGEPLRNADRPKELLQIARILGPAGAAAATASLSSLERNLRRNVSMQIALEAFAVSLAPLRLSAVRDRH